MSRERWIRRTKRSMFIDAPAELLFRIRDDPREAHRWVKNLVASWIVGGGPKAAGVDIVVQLKVAGFTVAFPMHVVAYDPPRSITLRGSVVGMDYVENFTVVPEGTGCRMSYDNTVWLRGIARLVPWLFDRWGEETLRSEMENLKVAAEAAFREGLGPAATAENQTVNPG